MAEVSIVIPVHNVEKYLDVCLNSVIMQTFKDFEAICINDGSTDNSLEILEKYAKFDKRIKVISQENKGLSAARNTGVAAATGKYLTYVDSDDWLSPIMLEKFLQNIKKTKSDYVFSNICTYDMQKQTFIQVEFEFPIKHKCFCEKDIEPEDYFKIYTSAYAKLFRYDFIKNFKFPEGLIFEDTPYHSECFLSAKKIYSDPNPYYFYRTQRKGSIIESHDLRYLDIFKIAELQKNIFKKHNKFEKYKNHLLLIQMKGILQKIVKTDKETKKAMFNSIKQYYSSIDYSKYDLELLQPEKIFQFYQSILKMDFESFDRLIEFLLKKGNNA